MYHTTSTITSGIFLTTSLPIMNYNFSGTKPLYYQHGAVGSACVVISHHRDYEFLLVPPLLAAVVVLVVVLSGSYYW